MDDRLKVMLEAVDGAVMAWEDARRQLTDATAEGGAAVFEAEARLRQALGGIALTRWEALSTREASPRTAQAARELRQAAGSRRSVEPAMKAFVAAQTARDAEVREAAAMLAEVARRLASYGRLAERITGYRIDDLSRMSQKNVLVPP
jgi:hypothetical protein